MLYLRGDCRSLGLAPGPELVCALAAQNMDKMSSDLVTLKTLPVFILQCSSALAQITSEISACDTLCLIRRTQYLLETNLGRGVKKYLKLS